MSQKERLENEVVLIDLYAPIVENLGAAVVCLGDVRFECVGLDMLKEERDARTGQLEKLA